MTMSHIYVTSISHIDMSQLVRPPFTITLSCILIHLAFARTNAPSRSLSSVAHRNVPGRVFTRTSVRSLSAFLFPDTRAPSFFTHPTPTSLRFLSYSTRLSSLSLSLSLSQTLESPPFHTSTPTSLRFLSYFTPLPFLPASLSLSPSLSLSLCLSLSIRSGSQYWC